MVAPARPYRPAFLSPPTLVTSRSVPPRPAPPLSTCCCTQWIEMNRDKEEKSRSNPTIKKHLTQFSAPNSHCFSLGRLTSVVLSPSRQTPVNKKEDQKSVRERTTKIQQSTISYLLSSHTSALLRGIVTHGGRRAKRVKEKGAEHVNTRIRRNLPFCLSPLSCIVVVALHICEVDRVDRYYGFS